MVYALYGLLKKKVSFWEHMRSQGSWLGSPGGSDSSHHTPASPERVGKGITTYQDWHSPKCFLGFIVSQKPRGLNPHRCPLFPPLPGACRNWRKDSRRSEPQKV